MPASKNFILTNHFLIDIWLRFLTDKIEFHLCAKQIFKERMQNQIINELFGFIHNSIYQTKVIERKGNKIERTGKGKNKGIAHEMNV